MKTSHSSTTAEGMALVRAIETSRPADRRICNDPIARALVPWLSFTLSKWVIDSGLYQRMAGGTIKFITARERYIDDFLMACLREGFDQVVLLGAGFDTRAYPHNAEGFRIPGIEKTRVFEIDHPATQAVKLARLRKVIDPLPGHVSFIPVDFDTQTLEQALLASSYDPRGKTLFIWQGVTVYLSVPGVDSTLAFIAGHSAPGSAVIFDYFYNEVLRDTSRSEVKAMRRAAQVTGEEYLFGIDQGQVEAFLAQRGFCDVHNATAADLKRLYFTGPNAARTINQGCDIASAVTQNDVV